METIGLIAAMPLERNTLLGIVRKWETTKIGHMRGAWFQLGARKCLLVTSGMGFFRAKNATFTLLEASGLDLLVSFGIAGAVKPDLNIGDVIVGNNTCFLNNGYLDELIPLASLSNAAWESAHQVLRQDGKRLLPGTVITTSGSQKIQQGPDEIFRPVLDMETAGIAQIARNKGISLISFRSISDGPKSPIPFTLETLFDENVNLQPVKIFNMLIHHPKFIVQSIQVMKNSRIAANFVAKALIAVLSQPSPINAR